MQLMAPVKGKNAASGRRARRGYTDTRCKLPPPLQFDGCPVSVNKGQLAFAHHGQHKNNVQHETWLNCNDTTTTQLSDILCFYIYASKTNDILHSGKFSSRSTAKQKNKIKAA